MLLPTLEAMPLLDTAELFSGATEIHVEHEGEVCALKINDQNVLELISITGKWH
ncbi:MAG TPA: hypothetical protein VFF74_06220 [Methylophilaceae bacterium]|nr:hypothetical protein [Methylophilaceae bacterium]